MTDTDASVAPSAAGVPPGPEWKAIPGFPGYEASHRGYVRSIDRPVGGRQLRGRVLKARVAGTTPYPLVNLTDDQGARQTRTVHSLVLLAHVGECPEGQEALHFNDIPTDNRWPENLGYGPHLLNVFQRTQNSLAAPKPVKVCARCEKPFEGNGRRCHTCVVQLGELAAASLAEGADLEMVAEELGYPSAVGIWRLAIRYGGVVVITAEEINRQLQEAAAAAQPAPLLHRVTTTLRARFRGGDRA